MISIMDLRVGKIKQIQRGRINGKDNGEHHEEIGWGWSCKGCNYEFYLTGSLAATAQPYLSPRDWVEIYNALDSKLQQLHARHANDPQWFAHIESIMAIIGPDGENMCKE